MKDRKEKSRMPILAAGGIVLRNDREAAPLFAVVQSRKLETWGLPKGKLAAGEDAMTAAWREVLEETGHRVSVHEFLGTLVYEAGRRPKVVQFWRMEAVGGPAGDLMHDVKAVDWLPLKTAIGRLTHLREQAFLEQAGPLAAKLSQRPAPDRTDRVEAIRVPGVPLVPEHDADLSRHARKLVLAERLEPPLRASAADVRAPADSNNPRQAVLPVAGAVSERLNEDRLHGKSGKTAAKKTWGWLRPAFLHRSLFD